MMKWFGTARPPFTTIIPHHLCEGKSLRAEARPRRDGVVGEDVEDRLGEHEGVRGSSPRVRFQRMTETLRDLDSPDALR